MTRFHIPLCMAIFGLWFLSAEALPATNSSLDTGIVKASQLEPPTELTLAAALHYALESNPDLAAARNEVAAVAATIRQAGTRPNPEVSALVEDTRSSTRTNTLQLAQPIELGGKRAARIEAASLGRDAAEADLQIKRAEIRAAVITAYFDVVVAQERVRLAEASTALAQRATKASTNRVIAGKASPVEETKSKVAEANVRVEHLQAASELASARKRLTSTWGNTSPRFLRTDASSDKLPTAAPHSDLAARLANAPAIVRARLEIDRRKALVQVEKSRRTPNLTLTLGAKRDQQVGRTQTVLGLSMPLPLFDRNQGNLLEALRRANKAEDELASAQIRVDGDLAQAEERLRAALQELDLIQKEILPGATSAYDAASIGFDAGKFGFLDVLDAQRTLLQAKSQYLRVLSDAHRAAADIDRVLGEPFDVPSVVTH